MNALLFLFADNLLTDAAALHILHGMTSGMTVECLDVSSCVVSTISAYKANEINCVLIVHRNLLVFSCVQRIH